MNKQRNTGVFAALLNSESYYGCSGCDGERKDLHSASFEHFNSMSNASRLNAVRGFPFVRVPESYDDSTFGRSFLSLIAQVSATLPNFPQSLQNSLYYPTCEVAEQAMACAWAPALHPFIEGQSALFAIESSLGSGRFSSCDGSASQAINYISTFADDWSYQPRYILWADPRAWPTLFPQVLNPQRQSAILSAQQQTLTDALQFIRARAAAYVPGSRTAQDDARNACVFLKRVWLMLAALLYLELRVYFEFNRARLFAILVQAPISCRVRLSNWISLNDWSLLGATHSPRLWWPFGWSIEDWFPFVARVTAASNEEIEQVFSHEIQPRWTQPPDIPLIYRCPGVPRWL
ncbi:MAG: hypothetical protein R3A48_08375 [Polyangiales bacterium]